MGELFVSLFEGMSWATIVLMAVAVVLMIIEVYSPGLGVFGFFGVISGGAAIFLRVFNHGLDAVAIIAYIAFMLIIMLFLVLVAFIIYLVIRENDRKVKKSISLKDDLARIRAGKNGIALTDLNPNGKIMIDGEVFEAVAAEGEIIANEPITVVSVRKQKITITRYKSNDNE